MGNEAPEAAGGSEVTPYDEGESVCVCVCERDRNISYKHGSAERGAQITFIVWALVLQLCFLT